MTHETFVEALTPREALGLSLKKTGWSKSDVTYRVFHAKKIGKDCVVPQGERPIPQKCL